MTGELDTRGWGPHNARSPLDSTLDVLRAERDRLNATNRESSRLKADGIQFAIDALRPALPQDPRPLRLYHVEFITPEHGHGTMGVAARSRLDAEVVAYDRLRYDGCDRSKIRLTTITDVSALNGKSDWTEGTCVIYWTSE